MFFARRFFSWRNHGIWRLGGFGNRPTYGFEMGLAKRHRKSASPNRQLPPHIFASSTKIRLTHSSLPLPTTR